MSNPPQGVQRFDATTGVNTGKFVPSLVNSSPRDVKVTYSLDRDCLNNVNDSGMRWQIEGGKVLENGQHVANYSSVQRVSCGTTEQNTAQLWLTLFFLGRKPP